MHAAYQNGHGDNGADSAASGDEIQYSSSDSTDGKHDTGAGKDIFEEALIEPTGEGVASHAEDRQDHAG